MTDSTDSAPAPAASALARLSPVWFVVAVYTAVVWALGIHGESAPEGRPFTLTLVMLAAAFCLAEFLAVNIESRSETYNLTFIEAVLVAGLFFADPVDVVLGRIIGGLVVFAFVRRQSPHKLITNAAIWVAESTTAVALVILLRGTADPTALQGWVAVFVGTSCGYLVGAIIVTAAIALVSGWPGWSMARSIVLVGGGISVAVTSVALGIVITVWNRSNAGLLFAGTFLILFLLYRAYARLTHQHQNLERLHDFTRSVGGPLALDDVEQTVLQGARQILRSEHGALLVPPVREDEPATRLVVSDDETTRFSISPIELASDLAVLLPDGESRLIEPGDPLPPWLARIGVTDGVVVPVSSDGMPSGAMVVVNRLTEVASFVEDDLRVFETLASHGGVALENGRLVATLQRDAAEKAHQALHDPVTDLPNRASLTERLGRAIAAARIASRTVGVIFVDLDTFKEVNDTLGTATGDRLLCEVRDRLVDLLPEGAVLARFTGDVFAVLLPDLAAQEMATALAEVLHDAFDEPFTDDAISLVLGASMGVALYPEHATSADLLLQRADAATYTARLAGSGIEVYRAETDPYAPRRLALAADLREALERDEVDVYVQPKVAVTDGTVLGAEALVRWTHHRLGPLGPDQFIPAAEHTGVIRALTLYVVRGALAQCRSWRAAGQDLSVSVNLSGRSLFDSHLVADIGTLIDESGVPAGCLTMELTESTVMGESHRSMEVLEGLHQLGVGISVDDFGTGYSSLTHLRRLPVTELKIDKSFVATMTTDEHDAVIVRTLVELGRNLGLRTVAEGVESQEAFDMLADIGCDEAQGYLLSRPLPADQFVTWLARQRAAELAPPEGVVPLRSERRVTGTDER